MSDVPNPLDLLPDGVVIAGPDGLVTSINAAAHSLLGVGDAVGRPLDRVIALQDKDGNDWFAANRPYQGLPSRTGLTEQSWFLADGTEVLITGRLHRSVKGGPVEQVAVVLRSARGRERLDRERSDLVAAIAHELRSPLTGVKGFVSTLLSRWESLTDEQRMLMLRTVHSDAERLSRLIIELLDVARIDTGRLPLYPRPVPPVALIDRVVESVGMTTTRALTHKAGEVPDVHADPDKLVQVITNLVENGVRHGSGRVLVTTSAADGHVRITVDDEGDGIPEELRRRVFTKFWKSGSGGTGLGMYIVHGLTKAHGADVTIGTAPGGGARITLLWPVAEAH